MPHPAKSLKEKQCLEGSGRRKGVAGCPIPEGGVGAAGLGVLASHPVWSYESVESGAVVGSQNSSHPGCSHKLGTWCGLSVLSPVPPALISTRAAQLGWWMHVLGQTGVPRHVTGPAPVGGPVLSTLLLGLSRGCAAPCGSGGSVQVVREAEGPRDSTWEQPGVRGELSKKRERIAAKLRWRSQGLVLACCG